MFAGHPNSGRPPAPATRYEIVLNKYFAKGSLTCLKRDVIQRRISGEFPLMLNIEPTNACNSRCRHCPRELNVEKHGVHFMKMDLYRKIIDQIAPRRLLMLNYHKDGEPLLHRRLPDMIAYAKEKACAEILHLNTNGILLDTDVGRGIIAAGVDDVTVSIDAASEASYRKLKRVPGLERVEAGVREVIAYRDRIGAQTVIRVKIMAGKDIDPAEIDEFRNRWTGIADQVQVTGMHNWGGALEAVAVTDCQSRVRNPCALLWYLMAVNSNGLVSKCNYDWNYSGVLGDIRQQSLRAIWRSPAARRGRQAHLQGHWDYNEVCAGCVAWVVFGDLATILADREEFLS